MSGFAAMIAKHVIYHGRVQGVGFRYTTHRIAGRYEVTGFVKNLPDRTVELFIQGPVSEVQQCLAEIDDYFGGNIRERRINEIPMNLQYSRFSISY
jgi:acylphosphatase